MKKILITGKSGYIGTSFARWLGQWPEDYAVDTLSMRGGAWREISFCAYDAVIHAAGIVHRPDAPETLYAGVNRDLAAETAEKAKREGVGQFILMSTLAVYGVGDAFGRKNEITGQTRPAPKSPYGISKYEAEGKILALRSKGFAVCAVRAPMVYGAGCKGNYQSLRRLTLRYGLIPAVENERSMIYIGNLCAYLRLLIDGAFDGIFCPQDGEYACTAALMEYIALENGRPFRKSRLFAALAGGLAFLVPKLRKAFGSLTCARELSVLPQDAYCLWTLRDAVRETESGRLPGEGT